MTKKNQKKTLLELKKEKSSFNTKEANIKKGKKKDLVECNLTEE